MGPELGALPPERGRQILAPPGGSARNCRLKQTARSSAPCGRRGRCGVSASGGLSPGGRDLPPGHRLAPVALAARPKARQLGSAPAAPAPNCRVLRRMYSSALRGTRRALDGQLVSAQLPVLRGAFRTRLLSV